jgi:LmbE family N-acetylglucosaminyl deacetylase
LSGAILGVLQSHRYASVFCPGPSESHADHAAAYALLRAALQQYANDIEVWLYEVWTPLEPNMVIPIDATIEVKMAAIRAHESQLAVMDYATAFRGLAQYRSLFCPTSRYAEAFFTCDRISLLEDEDLPWLGRQPSGLS